MTQVCKNQCKHYKAPFRVGVKRYEAGQKRCYYCDIFIIWDGQYCPCCSSTLRYTKRYQRAKLERVRIE